MVFGPDPRTGFCIFRITQNYIWSNHWGVGGKPDPNPGVARICIQHPRLETKTKTHVHD